MGPTFVRFAGGAITLLLVSAAFMAKPPSAVAVVTFDLIHDSPEMRRALKGELELLEALPEEEGSATRKPELVEELERIWFEREKFLQIGEKEKAARQMDLLWQREMEKGIRNLPEYGEVLVREARRDIERSRFADAEEVLTLSRRLSPEFLPAYFARAALILKKGVFNFLDAGREIVKGAGAVKRSFRLQVWAATSGLVIVNAALAFFFAVFVAVCAMRNSGQMVHDISENLPFRLSATARRILGWIILFLPVLVGLPLWWWFILAGFALLPYAGPFPRAVLCAGALYLATFGYQAGLFSSLLSMHRQPLLERVVTVREDHWGTEDYQALRQLAAAEQPSALTLGTLGLAAKRLGRFDEAEKAYRDALELDPENAGYHNNLGNLALIAENVDTAISDYEKAIGIDPDLFAAHYNLSVAYRDKFLFPQGEASSARAVAVDPVAHSYYTSIAAEHYNRETVDELPSLRQIWALGLADNKWQQATKAHLWMALGLVVPLPLWLHTLGGLLLFSVAIWAFRASRGAARSCPKCGKPYCSRCSVRGRDICAQCYSIFVRKEGVEAKVRVRKMAEIKRRQQIETVRRIALAALVPGGGHCSAGRYIVGTFFMLPAAFFLASTFFVDDLLYPSVWHLQLTTGKGPALIAWGLYLLWWGLSLWAAIRLED